MNSSQNIKEVKYSQMAQGKGNQGGSRKRDDQGQFQVEAAAIVAAAAVAVAIKAAEAVRKVLAREASLTAESIWRRSAGKAGKSRNRK